MGSIIKTVGQRLGGKKPSPFRAIAASTVAGVAVAAVAYKTLRH
jgi:hypothetical protein